jgi:hypothetical protein
MIQNPAFLTGIEGGKQRQTTGSRTGRIALPLAGIVAIGTGLVLGTQSPTGGSVVHAEIQSADDYDYDGLSNRFEQVLDCSPYTSDSDGDGFPDLEEFARGSDPSDGADHPLPTTLSVNMSASGEQDGIVLQIATYYRDGQSTNKDLEVGMAINGVIRWLPELLEQPNVEVTRWNDPSSTGEVLLISAPFPDKIVHAYGQVSVFSALSVAPNPTLVCASAVDLMSIDGIVGIIQETDEDRGIQTNTHTSVIGASSGSIYKPIPTGDGSIPAHWTPGEVCYQATVEVGMTGGTVTREVVGAGCVSGGGGCPSSCATTVGDVFDTFDPIGLIGG